MSIRYALNDIWFEWDSSKASVNLRKHNISFETACEVFFDPFVCAGDEQMIDDEVRETVIGLTVDWQLLYIAYTIREHIVRLISVRLANRYQRKIYEDR